MILDTETDLERIGYLAIEVERLYQKRVAGRYHDKRTREPYNENYYEVENPYNWDMEREKRDCRLLQNARAKLRRATVAALKGEGK